MFNKLILTFILAICAVANSLRLSRTSVLKPFVDGNALKIIAGINNFNAENVKHVCCAACQGGASHIDLACNVELVKMAKGLCGDIPICVSSIKPMDFVAAVEAGADMVEIGNFDGFYEQGLKFTAEDVVSMTLETRALLPTIPLSVTIPHTLSLPEQIELAKKLEESGADVIQTEGKMAANLAGMGVQELIEVAAPTIASAFALSRAVKIPVMCASGLTDVTAPLALAAGARGVGIGSMVNKLPKQQQMLLAVSAVAAAIGRNVNAAASQQEVALESEKKTVFASNKMSA